MKPTDATGGAGDPARTLALLWRGAPSPPARGPRPGLTVDAIVDRATALADADGLEALTMRRLAAALGVSPMTLYTYVPGREELVELMLDAAFVRMPREDTRGRPWRERVLAVADANRLLFARHPWATAVSSRPPLGPGLMAKYEHELAALEGLGLDDLAMDDALSCVLTFVQGWARAAEDAGASRLRSAMDDAAWWAANAELLARVFDPAAHPLAARVGAASGAARGAAWSPEHVYRFGLARLLDGLEALVAP